MLTTEKGASEELTDAELRVAYLTTSQEVGNPAVERFIADMAKREIDF